MRHCGHSLEGMPARLIRSCEVILLQRNFSDILKTRLFEPSQNLLAGKRPCASAGVRSRDASKKRLHHSRDSHKRRLLDLQALSACECHAQTVLVKCPAKPLRISSSLAAKSQSRSSKGSDSIATICDVRFLPIAEMISPIHLICRSEHSQDDDIGPSHSHLARDRSPPAKIQLSTG
jgi:hypothetical protein